MVYATEPKCNYCDVCMHEYCGCKLGRIKEMEPTCDSTAVIPSITVESVEGITNLANCLVHVEDINTTFYVDDKHRVMITWAGPVDIPGYDMENNPNGYRDQILTDIERGLAVIYDKHGNGYTFGIYDSLDSDGAVTQAINDKLDEMAADGTLEDIIAEYIGEPIYGFDTVSDMKASTTLKTGDRARTLGFYNINDGGGALYKISDTGTANEIDTIAVGDLYAELVREDVMSVAQFGAKGDGIRDDADSLIACFDKCSNIVFGEGASYLSSKNIDITNSGVVNLNGATIIMHNRLNEGDNSTYIFSIKQAKNVEFMNGTLLGDIEDRSSYSQKVHCLVVNNSENINIHNLKISQATADGITVVGGGNFIDIHDCEVFSCGRNNISVLFGDNITLHDINTHDCQGKNNPGHGIDIEPWADAQPVRNLEMYNIYTKNNYGSGVNISYYENGETSTYVHDIYSSDPFTIKLSDDSNGSVNIKNLVLNNELFIQDPVSGSMSLNIDNVLIKDYNPVDTSSFWGSAIKIRAGISSTSSNIKNLSLNHIVIEGGTPTRGFYIAGGSNGNNNFATNIECKIDTIPVFTASNDNVYKGWEVTGLKTNYIASSSSSLMLSPTVNLTGDITISEGYPVRDKIKILNDNATYRRQITSQGANNYGLTVFCVPPKTECYITVNADGTIDIDADKVIFNIAAATSYTINVRDTNFISSIRSTHYAVYYVDHSDLIELKSDGSGTGVTLSLSSGVLSVTGHATVLTPLYLMK